MNNREIAGVKVFVSGETYDEYKGTLQEQIENLQSKIDKAIELLEDFKSKSKDVENEWAVEICELSIRKLKDDK